MRGLSEVPVIGAGWSFIVEVMENGEALAFGAAGSFFGGGLPGKVMVSGVGGGVYHAFKGGGLSAAMGTATAPLILGS